MSDILDSQLMVMIISSDRNSKSFIYSICVLNKVYFTVEDPGFPKGA